jgi:hypothetical protein
MMSRRALGARITVGAVLIAAGVAGEWLLQPQASDGSVEDGPTFAALVGTAAAGALLLTLALTQLRRTLPRRTRPARVGAGLTTAGAGLLFVSFAGVLVSGLALGAPHQVAFVPFLVGMLLLAAGPVTWGLALRRGGSAGAGLLVTSGLASFASLAIATDPWHDVALMAMLGAWAAAGLVTEGLYAGAGQPPRAEARSAAARTAES